MVYQIRGPYCKIASLGLWILVSLPGSGPVMIAVNGGSFGMCRAVCGRRNDPEIEHVLDNLPFSPAISSASRYCFVISFQYFSVSARVDITRLEFAIAHESLRQCW